MNHHILTIFSCSYANFQDFLAIAYCLCCETLYGKLLIMPAQYFLAIPHGLRSFSGNSEYFLTVFLLHLQLCDFLYTKLYSRYVFLLAVAYCLQRFFLAISFCLYGNILLPLQHFLESSISIYNVFFQYFIVFKVVCYNF